jgi:hypothetical protein
MPSIAPLLFATTFLVASNSTTTAFTTTNPVQIAACSTEPEFSKIAEGDESFDEIIGTRLRIKFLNVGSAPLSTITFSVQDDSGSSNQIVDSGTFSPGVAIDHTFESSLLDGGNLHCSVSMATFANGDTFVAPTAAEAGKR